jgi:protoporphyrinogen oxidase
MKETLPLKKIVIVGAGPAGLTAAFELSKTKKYHITVIEAASQVGGISKTINFNGNLIDIGGHRFFSKSQKVLSWWTQFLPIIDTTNHVEIGYHAKTQNLDSILQKNSEDGMLIRKRASRIYFNKKLFDYPLKINPKLFVNLGLIRSARIVYGILHARLFPIKEERNLEDFFINNFGRELYQTFFKGYTEKVWGKACTELSSEWGRQRIKSLKIRDIVIHSLRKVLIQLNKRKDRKHTLIERFLYPAKGPGMLWEKVAESCVDAGVTLLLETTVTRIHNSSAITTGVSYVSRASSAKETSLECDALFSTMPLKHLFEAFQYKAPAGVDAIAKNLEYRDFLIVGLELHQLNLIDPKGKLIKDNWLYIQEGSVSVGRLQIFNNWSPFMVASDKVWIGAEYFCMQQESLWNKPDDEIIQFALSELAMIGILETKHFVSGKVVRCPKAYPTYAGSYNQIGEVIQFLDTQKNIYPMGRNGLHKYNNQDHSMLTAFKAVEIFEQGLSTKEAIWAINSDDEYLG